ncbi:MAG TPA: chemotaxis response regulator protein-glutamate methylesterase [Chromatiales bacterium]|nr:chemotaxis response regulator protein-glutamate methylesterase [Thiotrichales bacterium]HIP67604.1 chemotaxis response regulator protein-glutamate methylesterase [Chromatiales bacterium]
MPNKIKVLIIDDSALVRKLLTEILAEDSSIDVVGTAQDPFIAREKIKRLNPDVLTLDVEMPKMDGITFLRNLMRLRPMPVVMVSSLTQSGADVTLQALEIGAVDFVSKPVADIAHQLKTYGDELIEKIKAAAGARVKSYQGKTVTTLHVDKKHTADVILNKSTRHHFTTTEAIVAIGASTGGTEAIKEVLIRLPADTPGIVITQHIPGNFSTAFANRMNGVSALNVCEARDGQQILPGHAYIAPGDKHLLVKANGARYHCKLCDGPPVNRHKPSVDVLFRSVAQSAGSNSVGILLTGMGDDGARGLKELQETGTTTIAQDEKTSVVWGMPGAAVKLEAADYILPLQQVASKIVALTEHERRFGT